MKTADIIVSGLLLSILLFYFVRNLLRLRRRQKELNASYQSFVKDNGLAPKNSFTLGNVLYGLPNNIYQVIYAVPGATHFAIFLHDDMGEFGFIERTPITMLPYADISNIAIIHGKNLRDKMYYGLDRKEYRSSFFVKVLLKHPNDYNLQEYVFQMAKPFAQRRAQFVHRKLNEYAFAQLVN